MKQGKSEKLWANLTLKMQKKSHFSFYSREMEPRMLFD